MYLILFKINSYFWRTNIENQIRNMANLLVFLLFSRLNYLKFIQILGVLKQNYSYLIIKNMFYRNYFNIVVKTNKYN